MNDAKAWVKDTVDALPAQASLEVIVHAVAALLQPSPEQKRWRRQLFWIRAAVSSLAVTFGVWSAFVAIAARPANGHPPKLSWALGLVFLVWSVGPAVWFFIEYNFLWPETGTAFEDLKYGQELSKAIWVGIAAVLITLYARG